MFEKEYAEETDIGPLDIEDIEGTIDPNNSELMIKLVEEYEEARSKKFYENPSDVVLKQFREMKEEALVEIEIEDMNSRVKEDRFDCESILSTYSNLYNQPKLIYEERLDKKSKLRINPKTGVPCGVLDKPGLTSRKLKELDQMNLDMDTNPEMDTQSSMSRTSRLSELSIRNRDETPEEKKARKAQLKEYRRERRVERKANQFAFKLEDKRQEKEIINLQNNLRGVKLL
jgi:protein LTV1